MRNFQNEVMLQAVRLRARSAETPAWLASAKEAMARLEAQGAQPKELALALAQVPNWPADAAAARTELDELARPVAELLSKSLCRIAKDAYGQPVAQLWGGAARVSVDASGVSARGALSAGLAELSDPAFFERGRPEPDRWQRGAPEPAPAAGKPADPRAEMARLRAEGEDFLEDIARDKGLKISELSAKDRRVHDQVNLMLSDPSFGRGAAQVLLMSDGELIEKGDYERHGARSEGQDPTVYVRAIEGVAGGAGGGGIDLEAELGSALLGLGLGGSPQRDAFRQAALESARKDFSAARVGRSQEGETGALARGFERGEALLRAAEGLGERASARARELAHERLTGFLRERGVELSPPEPPELSSVKERLGARRDGVSEKAAGPSKPRGGL